jgi:uncharacterized protein YyaL (SSP411 family)
MGLLALLWGRISTVLAVVLGLALAGGWAWHQHQVKRLEAGLAQAQISAKSWQAAAEQEAQARAQEARVRDKQQEALNAAHKSLQRAQADAAGARSAVDRLRQRAEELAARGPATDSCVAAGSSSTPTPGDLLADVLARAAEHARQLAEYADSASIAGRLCEQSYDALKR